MADGSRRLYGTSIALVALGYLGVLFGSAYIGAKRADAGAKVVCIEGGDRVDVAHPQGHVFDARVHASGHSRTSSVCGSPPTTNTLLPTRVNPCLR